MVKKVEGGVTGYEEFVEDQKRMYEREMETKGEDGIDQNDISPSESSDLLNALSTPRKATLLQAISRINRTSSGLHLTLKVSESLQSLYKSKLKDGQDSGKYVKVIGRFIGKLAKVLSGMDVNTMTDVMKAVRAIFPLISRIESYISLKFTEAVIDIWAKSTEVSIAKSCAKVLSLLLSLTPDKSINRLFLSYISIVNPSDFIQKSCIRLLIPYTSHMKTLISRHFRYSSSLFQVNYPEIRSLLCWEYINTIGIIVEIIGKQGNTVGNIGERVAAEAMKAAESVGGEFRWAPFRLLVMRHLITLERTQKSLIPGITSHLLSLLSAPDLHKRSKPCPAAPFSLYAQLDLEKQAVWSAGRSAVIQEACDVLISHLSVYARSAVFPEVCLGVKSALLAQAKALNNSEYRAVIVATERRLTSLVSWVASKRTSFKGSLSGENPYSVSVLRARQ